MEVRRITETMRVNRENDRLLVVTVYEPGMNKEKIKKENRLSKRHHVLYPSWGRFEFK